MVGDAEYVKNVVVSACPSEGLIDTTTTGCFSTQNESYWASDPNTPSLISRVLQADYTQQWCTWAFGDAVPADGPNVTYYNSYGGFNISGPRLALIDGAQDVWNEVCYHGSNATAAHKNLRYGENQYLTTGAGHHWDSYGILSVDSEPDFIRAAHEWEIRKVRSWLQDWDDQHGISRSKLKSEL